jgi:formylglycine-generating enzyme required for sulfatase activity
MHFSRRFQSATAALNALEQIYPSTTSAAPQPAAKVYQSSATPSPQARLAQELGVSLSPVIFRTVQVNAQGKIVKDWQSEVQHFEEDLGNGITLSMVAIPEGRFTMGTPSLIEAAQSVVESSLLQKLAMATLSVALSLSVERFKASSQNSEIDRNENEEPQHEVEVSAFFMGQFPVTQAQYEAVMGTNPSRLQGADRPVEQVSWHDAMEFCQRLSARTGRIYTLPSEAQWEYACRAGTMTPFYFGETITLEIANFDECHSYVNTSPGPNRRQTTNVGSFPANAWGLHDMHGNVWEWCLDHKHDNYIGAPTDGSAWNLGGNSDFRILRGGSWFTIPNNCRSAYRTVSVPAFGNGNYGFRVVCVAPGA